MKRHTVESAANAVRGIIRAFAVDDRMKIFFLALQSPDEDPQHTERSIVERALASVGGNIALAAKVIGCSRRTLQNRMRALGMPPGRDGRPPVVNSAP